MAEKEASLLLKIKEVGAALLDKLTFTLGDVASAAKALGEALVKPIEEFHKQEEAVNSLNQTMINNGIFTSELRNKYLEYASALQASTTFADDEAIAATSVLQAYLKQIPVTEELIKATADFAAAQGTDLASAAELVGKSIGTQTNALARNGIEITKNATEQERLTQVVDGLTKRWGGQAEAQADGLGSLKQLQNAFSDILETIGGQVAPVVTFIAKRLTELAGTVNGDAVPALGFLNDLFIAAVKFAYQASTAIYNIGANIGSVASIIATAMSQGLGAAKEEYQRNSAELLKIREEQAARFKELDNMQTANRQAQNAAAYAKDEEMLRQSLLNQSVIKDEQRQLDQENAMIKDEENRIAAMEAAAISNEQDAIRKTERQLSLINSQLKNENDFQTKLRLLRDKANQTDLLNRLTFDKKVDEQKKAQDAKTLQDQSTFLSHMSSLQNSSNQGMVILGKAAAIAQIWIHTAQAAAAGLAWGTTMGGPGLGATFSALAYAAGAAQVARVAGVQLAEGGVVKARPGGIQATIGEGGQDEAVIPLEDSGLSMGHTINITVNGGLLGDERTAHQFAKAVDTELLKLRRNNESVSFDERVV